MEKYMEVSALAQAIRAKADEQAPKDEWVRGYQTGLLKAACMLESAPTADVAPVVHGHNLAPLSMFECSVCGWSCGDTVPGNTETYNFCPNCGAKMDVLFRRG